MKSSNYFVDFVGEREFYSTLEDAIEKANKYIDECRPYGTPLEWDDAVETIEVGKVLFTARQDGPDSNCEFVLKKAE